MILITGEPKMLTQKRLREVLHYNSETGVFTWTKRRRRGKVAGTVHDKRGYLKVMIDGERIMLHRLAFLWMTGTWPDGQVEHKDGNPSNNAWDNLRDAASAENNRNEDKRSKNSSSPYKGVYAHRDRWRAMIRDPRTGQSIYLGTFATPEGAYAAYCEAAMKKHGDVCRVA